MVNSQNLKASVSFVGDGTTNKFYFGFDYINKQFIKVQVGEGETLTYPNDYTVEDRYVILNDTPSNGVPIRVYRETTTERIVEWADGAFIKASQMTLENLQQLHLMEEAHDYPILNSLTNYPDGFNFNALGHRITNVKDPEDSSDVVTKHYMESVQNGFVQQNTALTNTATEAVGRAKYSSELAKKWAMSPVSPDGVVDTNSPTGYTQSAKIWAALSKEYAGLSKFKLPIGYYNSVDEMRKSETAIVGRPCVTLGYYEPNDGGGAVYVVRQKKETDVENGSIVALDNGNVGELLIEGAVNVKQLGAKGDGATDDTPAIQHAINAYNHVEIPPGEYIFTTLTLKSNLKLIGMGGTLKLKDDVCTDTTKSYQIIWSDSSNENVTLDGLIINGNADNNSSYSVADVITISGTHCSIRNCTILNAPDSGIMFSHAINSTCEGNYIKGFRDCGIYVNNNDKADQKLGSIISKNIIVSVAQSGTTGIALKRICQQIQVVNNTIRNCQYGITHEQASADSDFSTDTVISGNVIIDNSNTSIILRGSANCVCSNNYIYSTSATAIIVESCQNCTISNNAIVQTYGDITSSISIIKIGTRKGFSPSDSITVVGNTIKINYVASTSTIYAFRVIGTSNTDPVNRISIIGNTVAYTYTSTKSDNAMLFRLSYVTSSIVTANTISGASKIGDIDQNTDSVVVNNQGDNYNTSVNGAMLITRMINGRAIYLLASSGAPSFAATTSDIALEKYPATAGYIGYVYDGATWKKFGAILGE